MIYLGFDADDTLWENETHYRSAEKKFEKILSSYLDLKDKHVLYETEKKNISIFGYGAKGFTLSMIESAIELTKNKISTADIEKIIQIGRSVMRYQLELYEGVIHTLEKLHKKYQLILITKGDLMDQEWKIRTAGIGHFFEEIEIISEKDSESYANILAKYEIPEQNFIMIGNSLRSDILPVLDIGARAIHIPSSVNWVHENIDSKPTNEGYYHIDSINELPALLELIIEKNETGD